MAEISASMVMKLRKMSGQGMMDCKNALNEADGSFEKAIEILRKKGLSTLAKRAERETTEGVVVSKANNTGKVVTMAALCCETDFVAHSDDFVAAADALANYTLLSPVDEGIDSVLETQIGGKKFRDILTETISKTGEKIEVGDYIRYKLDGPGLISVYIHFNKKVGAMLQIDADDEKVAASGVLKQAATDVAMHITAINPLALDKADIRPERIEQEKAIFSEQVKNKPANIIDKIVQGKLERFFAENCLLSQAFVKDDHITVAEVIANAGKQAGGQAKIKKFVRFGVG